MLAVKQLDQLHTWNVRWWRAFGQLRTCIRRPGYHDYWSTLVLIRWFYQITICNQMARAIRVVNFTKPGVVSLKTLVNLPNCYCSTSVGSGHRLGGSAPRAGWANEFTARSKRGWWGDDIRLWLWRQDPWTQQLLACWLTNFLDDLHLQITSIYWWLRTSRSVAKPPGVCGTIAPPTGGLKPHKYENNIWWFLKIVHP